MKINKKLASILLTSMATVVISSAVYATDKAIVVPATIPTANDNGAVDIVAGRTEKISFTIKENIKDSIAPGRQIKLTLSNSNAYFLLENGDASLQTIIKDGEEFVGQNNGKYDIRAIYDKSSNDRATELIIAVADPITSSDRIAIDVEVPVYIPVSEKDSGPVQILAEVRGTTGDSTNAANIKKPFTEEVKQTEVKVGLQNQSVSNFSLVETAARMFEKGEIKLEFVKSGKNASEQGIKVESIGELVTSGGIKRVEFDEAGKNADASLIKLNRTSKEAATLTIKDMKISVDRTTPEGTYDLRISGSAIDQYPDADFDGNKVIIKDFIKVTTQNTQDVETGNDLGKAKVVFTLDSNVYIVNGNEKTMDAKAYIQEPGYTMIPVRYVADALGVKPTDIVVDGKQVALFAGNRTIQLTSGSKEVLVNGATIQMPVAVVTKEGRTYVPVAELGRILGIKAIWDNTAKTATFEN